jgi:methylmalonyl-CoA/ethylmalonyl-CoA epimerase
MIKKINHIGIAVRSLGVSNEIFSKLFEHFAPQQEKVPQQNVNISFFPVGDSTFELLEPTAVGSSIAKFIDKRGEGIHHICLEVEGIAEEIVRLKNHGFEFVNDNPSDGGDGYRVVFLHPKSTNGVLIELCEKA